ncbi:deoxyribose-phosphate aldolase [Halovulum sp. GXIMD14793]
MTDRDIAARALACLDLTNLNDDCTAEDISALCDRANTPHGPTAAICIWPRFVSHAAPILRGTGIRIATVVNFPTGNEDVESVTAMTEQAVADGADEIDLVVPYTQLMEGKPEFVASRVERVKQAAGAARVKAILETGILEDENLIRQACKMALEGGADFLKTSTGKVPVNATPEAGRILLEEIKASGQACGFKPAGGVKTTADAGVYLGLCDEIMGAGWATPETFRIGASGVLNALLATLDGADAPDAGEGY